MSKKKGFKHFSRDNSSAKIASLSIASRPYELNYLTYTGRVPRLGQGALAQKNRDIISSVPNLLGYMPVDFFVGYEAAKRIIAGV